MPTVYRFYTKPSDDVLENSSDLNVTDKYPLYAFTNDKKLYKEFIKTRNMDRFVLIKSHMEKNEYVKFINSNSGCNIIYCKFYHAVCKYPSKTEHRHIAEIEVLCTLNEKNITEASTEDALAGSCECMEYDIFPLLFKKKYVDALNKILYLQFWGLSPSAQKYIKYMTDDEITYYIDYSYPDCTGDELVQFVCLFGNMLK